MKRAGAHVSAPVRGLWGSSPRIYFTLHALRLILMQSWQRNVDEMKYTIANITMNIMPIKSSSKNVTKFHTASMASGTSTLWLTKEFAP